MTQSCRSKQGQMRIVEVILASFIIVFALSFTNIVAVIPTSQKYEVTDLEKLGYNVLFDLDKQNILPRFIYNGEWENLTAALRVCLPMDVYFNVFVYELNNNTPINAQQIIYGDENTFKVSKNVASVTYGIVGFPKISNFTSQAAYNPRIIILQLTRG